jgi:penicillin-binding protein-related factor A (putative recombinase)
VSFEAQGPWKQKEKEIQNSILDYLSYLPNCFVFPIYNGAVYDPTRRRFRKPGKHYKKGVPDILGIYQGRPLAIEVKTPERRNRLSPEQKQFLAEYGAHGGIAFSCCSLDECIEKLKAA